MQAKIADFMQPVILESDPFFYISAQKQKTQTNWKIWCYLKPIKVKISPT